MGTWDTGTFDNDTAADWAWTLAEQDDLSLVEAALDAVLAAGDAYLEAPEAEEALAAAEVLARLRGRWGVRNAYTEPVDTWVEAHPLVPPAALVEKAQRAIARVRTPPSELLELWEEAGDDLAAWQAALDDLATRAAT